MSNKALTTIDNPWSPFTQTNEWRKFDETHGYHTEQLLATYAFTSDTFSDGQNEEAVDEALQEAVERSPLGIHVIIDENSPILPVSIDDYMKRLGS
jgi:hypothetical protein